MIGAGGSFPAPDVARLRQGTYRLLASGYRRPTTAAFEMIESGLAALDELGIGQFAIRLPVARWVESLRCAPPELIETEYVRLFGSGMDGALCPPIESQQLGTNLQGDPARHAGRIEDLMRRSGFAQRDLSLPPDHLAVELELLSALCGAEADAREVRSNSRSWLGWQSELVVVLKRWINPFARSVIERDRSGAFGRLAAATAAAIEHDHDMVRLLMNTSRAEP